MKPVAVILLAVVLLTIAADTPPNPTSAVPGRYQLFAATAPTMDDTREQYNQPFIFKLDTATGRTWMFSFYNGRTNTAIGWIELENAGSLPNRHGTTAGTTN